MKASDVAVVIAALIDRSCSRTSPKADQQRLRRTRQARTLARTCLICALREHLEQDTVRANPLSFILKTRR
jgi:hypothetical protein